MAGWVYPTGFDDPSSKWTDEEKAYDGNTNTYAVNGTKQAWVEYTLDSAISCDKVRVYFYWTSTAAMFIYLDVYYGGEWHTIYADTPEESTYVEISVGSTQDIDKLRIQQWESFKTVHLSEVQFNEVEAPPSSAENAIFFGCNF